MLEYSIVPPVGDGPVVLRLKGDLRIPEACQLKEALLEVIEAHSRICLDLEGVDSIDLSGLQLVCAAHRYVARSGKKLQLVDNGRAVLVRFARDAGIEGMGCGPAGADACLLK